MYDAIHGVCLSVFIMAGSAREDTDGLHHAKAWFIEQCHPAASSSARFKCAWVCVRVCARARAEGLLIDVFTGRFDHRR